MVPQREIDRGLLYELFHKLFHRVFLLLPGIALKRQVTLKAGGMIPAEQFIGMADEAFYLAKANGRNRIQ
jgi:hypothetical protein